MALGTPTRILSGSQANGTHTSWTTTPTADPTDGTSVLVLAMFYQVSAPFTNGPDLTAFGHTATPIDALIDLFGSSWIVAYKIIEPTYSSSALVFAQENSETWQRASVAVIEVSGCDDIVLLANNQGEFTPTISVNISPSVGDGIIYHAAQMGGLYTFLPGTGYTELHDQGQSGTFGHTAGYRLSTAATATCTPSGQAVWSIQAFELMASAGGGSAPIGYRHFQSNWVF